MTIWRDPETINDFEGWMFTYGPTYKVGEKHLATYIVRIRHRKCLPTTVVWIPSNQGKYIYEIEAWMPVEFPYPPCPNEEKVPISRAEQVLQELE